MKSIFTATRQAEYQSEQEFHMKQMVSSDTAGQEVNVSLASDQHVLNYIFDSK